MAKQARHRRVAPPTEIHISVKVLAGMFAGLAVLAVAVTVLDAWKPHPLADFLVKVFAQLMLVCVTSIASLLAGQNIERRNREHSD